MRTTPLPPIVSNSESLTRSIAGLSLIAVSFLLGGPAPASEAPPLRPEHGYEEESVRLVRLSGDSERYLRFLGRTRLGDNRGWWPRPGPLGQAPPGPLGSAKGPKDFTYDLDCVDRTFNRHGDGPWFHRQGWLPVERDPTAALVAERYCPRIESLRSNDKRKEIITTGRESAR